MHHSLFSDVYPIFGTFMFSGIQQELLYNGRQSDCFNILIFFIYWSTRNCDICCSGGVTVEFQACKVLSAHHDIQDWSLAHAA